MSVNPQYHSSLESLNKIRTENGILPISIADTCPICLTPFLDQKGQLGQRIVTHNKGGEKHPIDESCLKQWLKTQNTCPFDELNYNLALVFSKKERLVNVIKITVNAINNPILPDLPENFGIKKLIKDLAFFVVVLWLAVNIENGLHPPIRGFR